MKKKILAVFMSLCMIAAFASAGSFADGTGGSGTSDPVDNENVETSKTVSDNGDGTYTLTLDSYVTGKTVITEEAQPLDVVLVLDVSSSMDENIVTYTYNEQAVTASMDTASELYSYMNGYPSHTLYVKIGENYYQLGSDRYRQYVIAGDYRYYFSANGSEGTHLPGGSSVSGPASLGLTGTDGKFYVRGDTIRVSKINALQNAAKAFVNSIASDAADNDVVHRIAIVKFAQDNIRKNYNGDYVIGNDIMNYWANYTQICNNLTDVSQSAGANALNSRIDSLNPGGYTASDKGMEVAKDIMTSSANHNNLVSADTTRDGREVKKVVVMFTDGLPNVTGGTSNFDTDIANGAISSSKDMKDAGVTVYTIGLFSGADSSDISGNPNKYLHYTSSNYPNAQSMTNSGSRAADSDFYKVASDAEELRTIFETIAEESGGAGIQLNSETEILDVISPSFELCDSSGAATDEIDNISVTTSACTGKDGSGNFTFADPVEYTGADVTFSDGNLNIEGFDFSQNYVGIDEISGTSVPHGCKITVTLTIKPKSGFLGGNGVLTNGTESGIYDKDGNLVENYDAPTVDVPIPDVTLTVPDRKVYYGQNVTSAQLKSGVVVKCGDVVINDPSAVDDWQKAYVNIDIEGLEDSGTVAYTDDTTYSVKGTVAPKTTGNVTAKDGTMSGNVFVYKPVITVSAKDYNAVRGEQVTLKSKDLVSADSPSVEWKRGAAAAVPAEMTGTAPAISNYVYTFAKAAGDGTLSGDTQAYTVNRADSDFNVTKVNCTVGSKPFEAAKGTNFVVSPAASDGHDFTIYIKMADLTIIKQYLDKSGQEADPVDPDQVCIFEVRGSGANADIDMQVAVKGNGEVTIKDVPYGSYTVSELTDWTWRYAAAGNSSMSLTVGENGASVSFKNKLDDSQWQSAMADVKNFCKSEKADRTSL